MTKHREAVIARARVAGYHNDSQAYWRICVEERVNRNDLRKAWVDGANGRRYGMRCTCRECAA